MARSRWVDALLVIALLGVAAVGAFAFRSDVRRWLGIPDAPAKTETVMPNNV